MQAHSPKGFGPLGLSGHKMMAKCHLYRTVPRPGSLLLKGVLVLLNNHPPHKQLTTIGAWGKTHRQDRKSQRKSTRGS